MEAVDECIPSDAGAAADEADLDIKSVVASGVKVADDGTVTAIPGSNLGMLFVAVLEYLLKRKDARTKWVYKKTLGIRWNLLLSEVLVLCWFFSFHLSASVTVVVLVVCACRCVIMCVCKYVLAGSRAKYSLEKDWGCVWRLERKRTSPASCEFFSWF
jgi:hypothetical protein